MNITEPLKLDPKSETVQRCAVWFLDPHVLLRPGADQLVKPRDGVEQLCVSAEVSPEIVDALPQVRTGHACALPSMPAMPARFEATNALVAVEEMHAHVRRLHWDCGRQKH